MDSDYGDNQDLAMDVHLRYLQGPDPEIFEPDGDVVDGSSLSCLVIIIFFPFFAMILPLL